MFEKFYCIAVLTGKEDEFKKNAKLLESPLALPKGLKIHVFKKLMRLKKGKIYEQVLFPGYIFLQTSEDQKEDELVKLRRVPGFIKFLHRDGKIQPLTGKDLEIIKELIQFGSRQGFVKAKFDENDKIILLSGPFAGKNGTVIQVNRRNHRVKVLLAGDLGIKVDLTYYDIQHEDWSKEEDEFKKKNDLPN